MYIIICLILISILLIYLISRDIIFVAFMDHGANPARFINPVHNANGCWTVFASEDVLSIPVGQWREVPTDLDVYTPQWYIRWAKLTIYPLGNVGVRVYPLDSRAAKGIITHNYIASGAMFMDNDKNIPILLYNNGAYSIRIRRGDPIAQIELYKIHKVVVYDNQLNWNK